VLIIFSILIVKQIAYITERPIGLDKQVVEIKIPPQYSDRIHAFKEELMANSSVHQVAVADETPFSGHSIHLLNYKKDGTDRQVTLSGFHGDEKYASTLGIQILEGSDFTDSPLANKGKFLINESLARLFPGQNLVGTGLPGWEQHVVAGVVKDFHYSSLKSLVEPAFIYYSPACFNLVVKPLPNKIAEAHSAIAQVWQKLIPDYPLNTETIGDQYKKLHQENQKYLYLIGACCIISVFLSMIGLFAISFRNSVHRTKEIGIRKINGAKVSEVLLLLNRDFVKWVAIAFVVAIPIAYYAMSKWLENFAYKTDLSWWIFALAGLLAIGIALLTVSWQSWRAATRNPVEALRYE
jgi:putative ABC transport system permease protein